jgi:hypothetical protein
MQRLIYKNNINLQKREKLGNFIKERTSIIFYTKNYANYLKDKSINNAFTDECYLHCGYPEFDSIYRLSSLKKFILSNIFFKMYIFMFIQLS